MSLYIVGHLRNSFILIYLRYVKWFQGRGIFSTNMTIPIYNDDNTNNILSYLSGRQTFTCTQISITISK